MFKKTTYQRHNGQNRATEPVVLKDSELDDVTGGEREPERDSNSVPTYYVGYVSIGED